MSSVPRIASFYFLEPTPTALLGVYPANRLFDVAALADLQGLSMILRHVTFSLPRALRSLGRNRQSVHSAPSTPSMPHAHVPFPSHLAAFSPPSYHIPFCTLQEIEHPYLTQAMSHICLVSPGSTSSCALPKSSPINNVPRRLPTPSHTLGSVHATSLPLQHQEVELLAHIDGLRLSNMTTLNNKSGSHSSLNEYCECSQIPTSVKHNSSAYTCPTV